jgi:hypothetical protein
MAFFLLLDRSLGEFALQGATMHFQGACGGRDIAIMLGKDFLQMFPL